MAGGPYSHISGWDQFIRALRYHKVIVKQNTLITGDGNSSSPLDFSALIAAAGAVAFSGITGNATDNASLATALGNKANLLGGNSFTGTQNFTGILSSVLITEQQRLAYDVSNYYSLTIAVDGKTSYNVVGTAPNHQFKTGGTTRFTIGVAQINPALSLVPTTDGTLDLGGSSNKFSNIYGVNVITTGTYNGYTPQASLRRRIIGTWTALPEQALCTALLFGTSLTAPVARAIGSTNYFVSWPRVGLATTVTTANQVAASFTNKRFMWRGNAAGLGGFDITITFGISTATATVPEQLVFAGVTVAIGAITGGVDPNTLVDSIGVAKINGNNNLQVLCNDASGAASMVDLGSNFPVNTISTDVYELRLVALPNASSVAYTVTRLNSPTNVATGTLSTNIPASTTFLSEQVWTSNAAAASLVAVDVYQKVVEINL